MSRCIHKFLAFVILIAAGIVGCVSNIIFMLFLYAGALDWIKLDLGGSGKLVLNGALSLSFFLQHSGMIRRSFRKKLSNFIPAHYQGAIYTLASGIVLFAFVVFWQNSGTIFLAAVGPFRVFLRVLFFLSIFGMFWGIWALRSVDMFGLDPVLKHLRAAPIQETPFTIRGPYRWVRHPLYLFMLVLFWSCPDLTTDRLLFNMMWTLWVVGATILEERDLEDDFGDAYRDYQAKVPMLLPRRLRPSYSDA